MSKIHEDYSGNLGSSEQHSTEQHSTTQHSTDSGMAGQRAEFLEEYTLLDPTRGKMSEMYVFHCQRNSFRIRAIFNINVKNP